MGSLKLILEVAKCTFKIELAMSRRDWSYDLCKVLRCLLS